jgi:phosphopantothenoylcysteine decarboxylase / phosphopantothenate---cysteine ligase
MIKGKKILLGITGSIAAYKAASLVRLFKQEGAEVKVIITPYAGMFITPLTLSTLAENPVLSDFYTKDDGTWNSHIDLGNWADIFLIAPATANTMAKMANGMADNLLTATYLAANCRVTLAPAMDTNMYMHPATQKNIETLKNYGCDIIEPQSGYLASGLEGKGRMQEPEQIVSHIKNNVAPASKKKN